MKKFLVVLAAVAFVAACSDSTAPSSDLAPAFAKEPPPPPPVTGTHSSISDNFNGGTADASVDVTSSAGISTAGSEPTIHPPDFSTGNNVLGTYGSDGSTVETLNNEAIQIGVAPGAARYSIEFDLYLIGSWDGRGQQAQHGAFGLDSWRLSIRCSNGTTYTIFETSFSNQKTVQQHYPRQVTQGGGSPYLTGSVGRDELGFNTHVPSFESAADSHYDLSFIGSNPCGTAGFTFVIDVPNFDLQSDFDESWTIDNLVVKTDS